jgi:hypothetical protein
MAQTERDDTTPDGLRLASAELAFVTELVGSEERAIEVMDSLLDDLAKGLIRWDCDDLAVRGDFRAYPLLRGTYANARGRAFFWRRGEDSRVGVDWPESCAVWMGTLSGFSLDGRGDIWPSFDPCASTTLMASGVRFHHGDFVDRLVARGLMSQPAVVDADTGVKAYFKRHPQRPDEMDSDYIDRLYELSKPHWQKKTLQNAFYANRRQSHN